MNNEHTLDTCNVVHILIIIIILLFKLINFKYLYTYKNKNILPVYIFTTLHGVYHSCTTPSTSTVHVCNTGTFQGNEHFLPTTYIPVCVHTPNLCMCTVHIYVHTTCTCNIILYILVIFFF